MKLFDTHQFQSKTHINKSANVSPLFNHRVRRLTKYSKAVLGYKKYYLK